MYDVVCMEIVETFGYIQQLGKITLSVKCNRGEGLTRLIRLALGFFSMNSVRVSLGNHSKTICKGFFVIPIKETMFG